MLWTTSWFGAHDTHNFTKTNSMKYSFILQRAVHHATSSPQIYIHLSYRTLQHVCSDCLYVIINVKE